MKEGVKGRRIDIRRSLHVKIKMKTKEEKI